MKKILSITWKDLLELMRDRTGLLLMLAAPFSLTLAITFAFGGGSGGFGHIPVVIVDQDQGELSQALADVFSGEELTDLIDPIFLEDAAEALERVDQNNAVAAVVIPSGFTSAIYATYVEKDPYSEILVYTNPASPISSGVVQSIVYQYAERVNTAYLGASVTIMQLLASSFHDPSSPPIDIEAIGQRSAEATAEEELITLVDEIRSPAIQEEVRSTSINWMQYYAASMAILFLMFSMTSSARSLLHERDTGTYDRLKASPSYRAEILGGKMLSTFTRGLLQMSALILSTGLLLHVSWGNLVGVFLHTVLTVAVMAALGLVIASLVKTSSQASLAGTATVLILGVISGNYFPRDNFPDWLKSMSNFSPSTLGIEGYQHLAAGYMYSELSTIWIPLLLMTVLMTGLAILGFRRNLQ